MLKIVIVVVAILVVVLSVIVIPKVLAWIRFREFLTDSSGINDGFD
jgi:Tfp pilus assembly protein FimT